MKKIFEYEVGIQVNEIWVYKVNAKNFKEAVNKISNGDETAFQICSVSGGPNSRKPKLYGKKRLGK